MPQTEVRLYRESDGGIPFQEWLDLLEARDPVAHAKCLQRVIQLSQLGHELRRPLADILRDGIHELRAKQGHVHYRILYFFHGRNAAVLSHGITKEGAVPDAEIDKAIKRKTLVEKNPEKHTAEWDA